MTRVNVKNGVVMNRAFVLLAVISLACSTGHTPVTESRAEIIRYVQSAAELVGARGVDACADLQRSAWFKDEWYVFVLDEDGRTVCHPARPEMIGRPSQELVDANGKRFGDEFLQVAARGGGWVDYVWPRPNSSSPEPKSSYVLPVQTRDGKTYIVGSGGHGIRPATL